MTGRAVLSQGALAAIALAAAYFTWQRQPELQAGEVFVLDITKNDLEKVRYEDQEAKTWAELSRANDREGPFVQLRLSSRETTPPSKPPSAASTQPSAAPTKVPERLVRGSESANKLFDGFAPLRATRALGVLDAAKLKDLHLDSPQKLLEVTSRAGKRSFALVPAPAGGSDPYLRDQSDGRVFVVGRSILNDLQSAATSLTERRLHGFRVEDADRLVVNAGIGKREFRVTRNDDGHGVSLVPINGDKPDQSARSWHDRVWSLWPSEILGKDEKPSEGEPKVTLRVDYSARGRSLGWLEIAEVTPAGADVLSTAPGSAPKKVAYMRSEMTLGWDKATSDLSDLMAEASKLTAAK